MSEDRTPAPCIRATASMIDTVIFDFDGVILDTETPLFDTWQQVFSRHGVELERSVMQELIGGGKVRVDIHQRLEELTGRTLDGDAIRVAQRRSYLDSIGANPLLPGVIDYLEEAKRMGLRLGVASSSSRDWVERHLAERGVLHSFQCVVTRDDVENVKPDPELYLTAMERLSTTPDRAVAIEDSLNGVTAAKRAGMLCVAVPNPMTDDMHLDEADLRLSSLSEMGLAAMLDTLMERR